MRTRAGQTKVAVALSTLLLSRLGMARAGGALAAAKGEEWAAAAARKELLTPAKETLGEKAGGLAKALALAKVAPVEATWPGRVGSALGKRLATHPPSERTGIADALVSAVDKHPELSSTPAFRMARGAAVGVPVPVRGAVPQVPVGEFAKKQESAGKWSKAAHAVVPTFHAGILDNPSSFLEHAAQIGAEERPAIGKALDAFNSGGHQKPGLVRRLLSPGIYRDQAGEAGAALRRLKTKSPEEAMRFASTLKSAFPEGHYLNELGSYAHHDLQPKPRGIVYPPAPKSRSIIHPPPPRPGEG